MKRSPLHLAVIFLGSLKFLPQKIIEKYIDARDLHGSTPLHLAELHHNEQAIQFLLHFRNNESATDQFRFTLQDLGSSVEITDVYDKNASLKEPHPDVRHYELCRGVIEANEGVFEWDMIDCLPPSCRLAIVVSKPFVQVVYLFYLFH